MQVQCFSCKHHFSVYKKSPGEAVKCPYCGTTRTIPEPVRKGVKMARPYSAKKEELPPQALPDVPVKGMKPHRGTFVFLVGLLSIGLCPPLGYLASNMGEKDLAEMKLGIRDPHGKSLTESGVALGNIGIAFFKVWLVLLGILLTLFLLFLLPQLLVSCSKI